MIKVGSLWRGSQGADEFKVTAVWNPNEEQDPWVKYTNQQGQEFTCRLEAFQVRFSPLPVPA